MKRWLWLTLILLSLGARLASGQGTSYPGTPVALTRGGFPAAGARVTVCAGNVAVTFNANPPCAPYASIFSDPALTVPIAQPGFVTDGLGNYPFFVAGSATYTIVLDGSGLTGYSTVWNAPLTANGPINVTQLSNCQHVNANQTLQQAVAAVSSPGCIYIDINFALTASVTIPSTVTTVFMGQGGVTTTGFTLAINGPMFAPQDAQLFFGTGTVTLGPVSSAPYIYAVWFPGGDCGAKINAAAVSTTNSANIVVNTNCGTTVTTAFSLPVSTKVTFLAGAWTFNVASTIANSQVILTGVGWGQTFWRLNFQGDWLTVTGPTFQIGDASIQAALLRTSGAVINGQAGGGIVKNLYLTDPFRGFQFTTCPLGQWSFENIRFQSGGGNWDSLIYGACTGTNLLNSFSFNNINGNVSGAAALSAPLILLDSGIDTWNFSNLDLAYVSGSFTQPIVQLQSTTGSVRPRNVHFTNSNAEAGVLANSLFVANALNMRWTGGNLSSALRGCQINGGVGSHFVNVQFINNQDEGCIVTGGTDTEFIGSNFSDNSASSNGGFNHLSLNGGISNFKAIGNEFSNAYQGNANLAGHGIGVLSGASDTYQIIGNNCNTAQLTGTCIFDAGTGTNKIILGNTPLNSSPVSVSVASLLITDATPSVSPSTGFNTGSVSAQNGAASFDVTVGSGTANNNGTITFSKAAAHGWNCWMTNLSRVALITQTGGSTTTAVMSNFNPSTLAATNWTNGDGLIAGCMPN